MKQCLILAAVLSLAAIGWIASRAFLSQEDGGPAQQRVNVADAQSRNEKANESEHRKEEVVRHDVADQVWVLVLVGNEIHDKLERDWIAPWFGTLETPLEVWIDDSPVGVMLDGVAIGNVTNLVSEGEHRVELRGEFKKDKWGFRNEALVRVFQTSIVSFPVRGDEAIRQLHSEALLIGEKSSSVDEEGWREASFSPEHPPASSARSIDMARARPALEAWLSRLDEAFEERDGRVVANMVAGHGSKEGRDKLAKQIETKDIELVDDLSLDDMAIWGHRSVLMCRPLEQAPEAERPLRNYYAYAFQYRADGELYQIAPFRLVWNGEQWEPG